MSSPDSYNRGGFYAFLFSMAFSLCFFVYVAVIYPGINLREVPEATAAGTTEANPPTAATSVDISKVTNPWVSSDDMIAYGKNIFQNNCAICHGTSGMGDGPAGKSLVPPPRNLVEGKWKRGVGSEIDIFTTVKEGLPGTSMAPFGHLPIMDRWAVVHYVRSITKNKKNADSKKVEEFAKTAK